MRDVICIGSACVDTLVYGLEHFRQEGGEAAHSQENRLWIGGDAANEALVLSRLGKNTALLAAWGDDVAGRMLDEVLTENGVDTSLCTRTQARTLVSVVLVDADGERRFLTDQACISNPWKVCPSEPIHAKVVTLGSLYSLPLQSAETVQTLAIRAKQAGALLCADVSTSGSEALHDYAELWPYVDYVFPNRKEAESLTGESELEEMANAFLACGVKNVVIKTGARGCFWKSAVAAAQVNSFPVQAVDTTGAGDTFLAGFVAGLLEGCEPKECCRWANAAAALAVQSRGASTGVESMAQLRSLLEMPNKKGMKE